MRRKQHRHRALWSVHTTHDEEYHSGPASTTLANENLFISPTTHNGHCQERRSQYTSSSSRHHRQTWRHSMNSSFSSSRSSTNSSLIVIAFLVSALLAGVTDTGVGVSAAGVGVTGPSRHQQPLQQTMSQQVHQMDARSGSLHVHHDNVSCNNSTHHHNEPFTDCGHLIEGATAGIIHSPFFPRPFPVPIYCKWTIKAPAGKVVAIFLSQFYLRDGFKATEYAFLDSNLNVGKRELGPVTIDAESAILLTTKPILVLELELYDASNIHVRVMDFFLDVYGFNITYQLVPKDMRLDSLTRIGCSAAQCSFTGTCYASLDHSVHYCQCFPGYFGRRCQYGPGCDPSRGINQCKNNGACRYAHGGSLITCDCTAGFTGIDCADTIVGSTVSSTSSAVARTSVVSSSSRGIAASNIVFIEISSTQQPLMENTELNITCAILVQYYSNALEVTWYKDGLAINFAAAVERQMSARLLPRNSQGLLAAELYIERVHLLDIGVFTCEARDFDFTLNSSIKVTITTLPPLTVSPKTKTVKEGDRIVLTCFGREDVALRKYGYNWLKNGEILNPIRENEQIEDLYPTGSRIIVPRASRSATYTCLATTPAGTAMRESQITVVPRFNASSPLPTCTRERKDDLEWPTTGAYSHFVQSCPLNSFDSGEVRRFCRLMDSTLTRWDEPDFSACFSQRFVAIRLKFQKLRLGYEVASITSMVHELTVYLSERTLRHNEGVPIVDFLTNCLTYLQSVHLDKDALEQSVDYALDVLSLLLDHPGSINKPADLSLAHHMIVEYAVLRASSGTPSLYVQIARPNFWSEIVRIDDDDTTLQLPLTRSHNKVKNRKSDHVTATLDLINNNVPRWLTDTVELNLSRWHLTTPPSASQDLVLAVFYRNLGSFLPKHFLHRRRISDIEYQIHSRLVTVALLNNSTKSIGQQSKLKIKAHLKHHNTTNYMPPSNTSEIACGVAELNDRIGFHTQNCKTSSTNADSTVCLCDLTGTYAIILTSQIRLRIMKTPVIWALIDLQTAVGATFALLTVLALLALLLIQPRRVFGTRRVGVPAEIASHTQMPNGRIAQERAKIERFPDVMLVSH